jgi:hypothetical protein
MPWFGRAAWGKRVEKVNRRTGSGLEPFPIASFPVMVRRV